MHTVHMSEHEVLMLWVAPLQSSVAQAMLVSCTWESVTTCPCVNSDAISWLCWAQVRVRVCVNTRLWVCCGCK